MNKEPDMPRILLAALFAGAVYVADALMPHGPLIAFPEFHPRLAISVSLSF